MAEFKEVTRTSWVSRLGKSITGIGFGLLIFVLGFPLLFWNESRAVKVTRTLDEGQGIVQTASVDTIDPNLEGQLVHVSGLASTNELLSDEIFAVSTTGIQLRRVVEMYQWKEVSRSETQNKTGGSQETVTTYDYEKVWSTDAIDSESFKVEGHSNPSMPYENTSWTAGEVNLGTYALPESLTARINNWQPLSLTETQIDELRKTARVLPKQESDWLYLQRRLSPRIGDTRLRYEVVPDSTVSVIAQQSGNTFTTYVSKYGSSINMLSLGNKTPEEMFEAAESANTAMTWGLRLLGFLMMAGGLAALFAPLVVMADVIPFFGNLLRMGTRLIANVLAFVFAFITIAIAWLSVRPVLSISLLVLAVLALVIGILFGKQRSKRVQSIPATS